MKKLLIIILLFDHYAGYSQKDTIRIKTGTLLDTTGLSDRINAKLNISDTPNIRVRPIAGTNMTITGTYPNLTFNSTGGGGGGGVTSVSDLVPLFTTTDPTGTAVFNLSNASGYTNFGNRTSSSGAPSYFTNPFVDSLKSSADSLYAQVNGQWRFQLKNRNFDTSFLQLVANNLGITQVDNKGFYVKNYGPATAGNQQISPPVIWEGQGWKTTATAGSQSVRFAAYVLPVQGSTNPTGSWNLVTSINGAAFGASIFSVSTGGTVSATAGSFTGAITTGSTSTMAGITQSGTFSHTFNQSASAGTNTYNNFTLTAGMAMTGGTNVRNIVNIGGVMNITAGTTTLRGIYYAPTLTSMTGTTHIAFENTTGDLLFNTTSGKVVLNSPIKLKGYTVATLPAGTVGDEAYVTDATAPTYLGVLVGGGAIVTPVFYNGVAWVSH